MLFFLTEESLNLPSKYQISCLPFDQTLQNFVYLREEIKEVKTWREELLDNMDSGDSIWKS